MGPTHRPFGPMARFLVDDLGKGVVIVVWGVTFPQLRNVQVDHPTQKKSNIYIYIIKSYHIYIYNSKKYNMNVFILHYIKLCYVILYFLIWYEMI